MNIKNVKTQSVFTKTKKESLLSYFSIDTGFEPNGDRNQTPEKQPNAHC